MDLSTLNTDDAVEVSGLSAILGDDETPAFLELGLRCRDRLFRAVIMAAGEEWALSLRDERGQSVADEPELYPSQSSAVLAAMLIALHAAGQAR